MSQESDASLPAELVELMANMRRCWRERRPDRPTAQDYRKQIVAASDPVAWTLNLVRTERECRRIAGEELPDEHFFQAFRDVRDLLQAAFEIERDLEENGANGDRIDQAQDPGLEESEVGRGGMAIVLRVRDQQFRRWLARKVLNRKSRSDPARLARFFHEAQITAQLQHPAIPVVYREGKLPKGDPYFDMKLVRGQTLEELLVNRSSRSAGLMRLLAHFGAVCDGVGYAHSRGVIHRDLKPANIMVGEFGEVQVVDWGLAKVLDEPWEPVGDSGEGPVTADSQATTQDHVILGTPKYMPPEQARGDIHQIDRQSDVFSLGAILYEILTGEGPYGLLTSQEICTLAGNGNLRPNLERLQTCGAEPELIDLAKKCLAVDPADRPANAGALAECMSAFPATVQEKRLQAERENASAFAMGEKLKAELRAWRLRVALAAMVLLTTCGLGIAAWVFESQRQEQSVKLGQLRVSAESALPQAQQLRQKFLFQEARDLLQRTANSLQNSGLEDLAHAVGREQEDLEFAAELDTIRQSKALIAMNLEGRLNEMAAIPQYRKAFRDRGLDVESGDVAELVHQIRQSAIREDLVAALDDWAEIETWRKGTLAARVASIANQSAESNRVRQAMIAKDAPTLIRQSEELNVAAHTPATLLMLGYHVDRAGGDLVPLWRRAQQRHPQDFWLNFLLAFALRMQSGSRTEEAIGYYRAALTIRPDSAAAHNGLGIALLDRGDARAASAAFAAACRYAPNIALVQTNHGNALRATGDLDAATAAHQRAIDLRPELAVAHTNLGTVLRARGDAAGAIRAHKKALELDPTLAIAHDNLGVAQMDLRDINGAIRSHNQAIKYRPKDGVAYNNLGVALRANRDLDGAIAAYRKAIELAPGYARAFTNLGVAMELKGTLDEAIQAHREAIRLDPRMSDAHANLGVALRVKGDLPGAIASCKKAIELAPRTANYRANLGVALLASGDMVGAVAAYQDAVRVEPKRPDLRGALGSALLRQGEFAAARQAFEQILPLLPQDAPMRQVARQQIQAIDKLLDLDRQHTAISLGKSPMPKDKTLLLDLVMLTLHYKQHYAAGAGYYQAVFTIAPDLDQDLSKRHRHNAARAAVLAAFGAGKDTPASDEQTRTRWRKQALIWAQEELAARREQMKLERDAAQALLRQWHRDPAWEMVRDEKSLSRFPAVERQSWRKVWSEMAELVR